MQPPPTHEPLAVTGAGAGDSGDAASPQPIYEQVLDVVGLLWNIRSSRPTKHGFPLHFGYPAITAAQQRKPGGNYRLIATPALVDYWKTCEQKSRVIFDLPAGESTLARLRQRLNGKSVPTRPSLNRQEEPKAALRAMREFANRFDVSLEVAQDWHFFLLDPSTRPPHWWKEPAALAVFRSSITIREMAETLRISEGRASRLRLLALAFE